MLANFYYETLTPSEKNAYRALNAALSRSNPECKVTGLDSLDSAERVWKSVVWEHPENVNYPGVFCRPAVNSLGEYRFPLQYADIDRRAYDEKLNRLINKINNKMSVNASDYAACKIIFDELASFIKYEDKVYDKYLELYLNNSPQLTEFMRVHSKSFMPYGVLTDGTGVCQGISKLFKIVCDRFNLQCACVEVKTRGHRGGFANHMFNVVEIDGERAFVDLTNCLKTENLPVIMYDYFLMPLRFMDKTFIVDIDFGCVNENLNYFSKNKLRFKTLNDLRKYLTAYTYRSTNGEVRCYYDGGNLSDRALQDLFFEVINSHCSEGYFMQYASVRNGICTGLIKKEMED